MAELYLPDFDLPGVPVTVSVWHAALGERVVEGDRLLEVAAGDVTIDLAAPASGVLIERCVRIDDRLAVGILVEMLFNFISVLAALGDIGPSVDASDSRSEVIIPEQRTLAFVGTNFKHPLNLMS